MLGRSRIASLLRNSIVQVTMANLLSVGLGTISGVLTARGLGPEGRGQWAVIMAYFTVALVVAELGQSGAVTFFVARDPKRRREVVRQARRIMLLGGVVVTTAGVLAAPALARGDEQTTLAYQVAAAGILINSFFAGRLYAMQARNIKRWNIARVAQPSFYALGTTVMLLLGNMTVLGVAVALITSTSLQFIVLGFLVKGTTAQAESVQANPRESPLSDQGEGSPGDDLPRENSLSQGGYGARYSAAAIPTVLAAQYDKIILSRITNPVDVGLYSVGSTVALLVAPFSAAIANVVFPKASTRELLWNDRRSFEKRTILQVLIVSIFVSVGLCSAAPIAVPFFFGGDYEDSVPVVWALATVMVARSISQVAGALIRARGLPGAAAIAQVAGLLVGAALMVPAVSLLGLLGAAGALGLGEIITLTVVLSTVWRLQRKDERTASQT